MRGQKIGYIRVSTYEQNTERQLAGLELDKTFTDKASGVSKTRPALKELLSYVREGDTVYVHSMDRLARDLDHLRSIVDMLTKKDVHIQFVTENLLFTGDGSHIAKLMLSMMGAYAEFERALLLERQREGIEQAKKRGAYHNRKTKPKALTPEQVEEIKQKVKQGIPKTVLAKEYKVHRDTIYTYLKE